MSISIPLPENLDRVRRIGVVADTHIPDRLRSLHPDLIPGLREAQVDLLIHAGDICAPSVLVELETIAPVVAVRGNRDWVFAGVLPWVRTFSIKGLRIAVHHGMGNFWNYWLDKMKYAVVGYRFSRYMRTLQRTLPGNDVYIFGHTHRREIIREGGVLYFNPGTAAITPPGWPGPSFGILDLDGKEGLSAQIIDLPCLPVKNRQWVVD